MDIHLIWATDGDAIWLVGAWDEDTIAENYQGYTDELARHQKDHGHDNVRVVKASVDFDAVQAAFQTPHIGTAQIKATD